MPKVVDADWTPGANLQVYSTENGEGSILGTIAIPVRDHLNAATVTSLLGSDFAWMPRGRGVNRKIIQGGILTLQRNEAVQQMEGDWLLFIDDDMVWQPDAIAKLIAVRDEFDLDIVGGLCFRRTPPHQPTLYMRELPTEGPYNFLEVWEDDLVEVDATGMAFCLIHKRVFEKIAGSPMPPLDERRKIGLPEFFYWKGRLGEDLRFCQDAKAAGCRIFVDTRIKIGHVAEVEITMEHYLREVAIRGEDVDEARRAINDRMGLPTLTMAEARKVLGWS